MKNKKLTDTLKKVYQRIGEQLDALLCDNLINENNLIKNLNLGNDYLRVPQEDYDTFKKFVSNENNWENFVNKVIQMWKEKKL